MEAAAAVKFVFNDFRNSGRQWESPSRLPLLFHSRLPGYRTTPLRSLDQLARLHNLSRIWVKDESHRLGLPAFKILGASWAAYKALERKYDGPVAAWNAIDDLRAQASSFSAFVTATDGNHGRGVARVAAMLGVRAKVFVPAGTVPARIRGIEQEGATVTVVDGTYEDAVREAAAAVDSDGLMVQDTAWDGYEQIPRDIVEGYSTMTWEIDEQLSDLQEEQPTHVIVQIGVGSLADAVIRHYRSSEKTISTIIIGVEPIGSDCGFESILAGRMVHVPGPHRSIMAGMNCGSLSTISWETIRDGIDCCVAISDDHARDAMRILARFGIVSGETGSAGMGALLGILNDDAVSERSRLHLTPDSRVLLISTEGATDPDSYHRIVNDGPVQTSH